MFPDVHLKLYDLSMGGAIPGAHIGGDARPFSLDFEVGEPGMTVGEVTQFVADAEEQLKKMHAVIQEEMAGRFLMERGK